MKYYIQYVDKSPVTGNMYAPCGDRSVVILDGRNNLDTMINDAHEFNGVRRPLYVGFNIVRGSFNRPSNVIYSSTNGISHIK